MARETLFPLELIATAFVAGRTTMVRNTGGGGAHKRCARKHSAPASNSHQQTRRKEEGEEYAIVTAMSGGQHCQVMCADEHARTCVIRKKFRGRGKRDNTLALGTWVLVAPRDDWERREPGSTKLCKCDLLEVYSSGERERLLASPGDCDFSALVNVRRAALGEDPEDCEISFLESDEDCPFSFRPGIPEADDPSIDDI